MMMALSQMSAFRRMTVHVHDVTTYIFGPTSSGRGTSVRIAPVTAPQPCSARSRGGGAHSSARASVGFQSPCRRDATNRVARLRPLRRTQRTSAWNGKPRMVPPLFICGHLGRRPAFSATSRSLTTSRAIRSDIASGVPASTLNPCSERAVMTFGSARTTAIS